MAGEDGASVNLARVLYEATMTWLAAHEGHPVEEYTPYDDIDPVTRGWFAAGVEAVRAAIERQNGSEQ